jgi:two-component system phosphate regulon response regulator PhoB
MDKSLVIIIEDEKDILDLIINYLKNNNINVLSFDDGKKAMEFIQGQDSKNVDLFILDRMLPSIGGIEILKFLRLYNSTKDTPILMLTALSTPEQIVEGLDAGADDYMTKPFDLSVLNARVRSLLRRKNIIKNNSEDNKSILKLKNLKLDMDQCKVWIDDQIIDLTLSEYKLLCCFLLFPGKVLTRNQLVEYIQDGPVHVTDRTIDTHIFGLRKKMGEYAQLIETIRGVGYRVANEENF